MKGTQSPEQVAGARIREIRMARHLTQAALAKAMKALGYNWLQTTVAKVEAAERPLRLNEITDLARVLGMEVSYIVAAPPSETQWQFSADFREMLRLQEIAAQWEAEAVELHEEFERKSEDARRARRQYNDALDRLREAGVVQDHLGHWKFPEGDTDGEH